RHTRFSRDWSSDVCSSDLCVPPSLVCFQPYCFQCSGPGLFPRSRLYIGGNVGNVHVLCSRWAPGTVWFFGNVAGHSVGGDRERTGMILNVRSQRHDQLRGSLGTVTSPGWGTGWESASRV